MLLRKSILVAAFTLLAFGFAVTAQAEPRLYTGSLIVQAFSNDTTDGTTIPFTSNLPSPIPAADLQCNTRPLHAKETKTLGTYYNTNTSGTLGNGNYYVFTIPQYGGAVATLHTAASNLVVPGCQPPTLTVGGPLTGSGTLSTTGLASISQTARGFTIPAQSLVGSVSWFSDDFADPYIFSLQYADLENVKGTFSKSAGPGRFGGGLMVSYTQGQGSINVIPGANAFGGTMRLLGTVYSNEGFKSQFDTYVAKYTWLIDYIGGPANASVSSTGNIGSSDITFPYTGTDQNFYIGRVGGFAATTTVKAIALSWTTGTVTVTAIGGPVYTVLARKGFDSRDTAGSGEIQMVSPMLTRWTFAEQTKQYHTGGVGILNVEIAPEPHEWMMLGAGLSMLGLLYRANRRSR